jgi:CHAT domain-containing protein
LSSFSRSSRSCGEIAIEIIRFQWRDQVYYSDTAFYAAYIVRHDSKSPEVVYLPTLASELDERYYNFYRNSINLQRRDPNSYNEYWKPIKSQLEGIRKVYFSPDGIYHLINMSGLENPETGDYLLEELELINVTSTANIPNTDGVSKLSEAVLIGRPSYSVNAGSVEIEELQQRSFSRDFRNASIADLPGTEEEVISIGTQLSGEGLNVESLLGNKATEDRLYAIQSPDILHIATHGFWSGTGDATEGYRIFNAMMNSGLLLAGVVDYYSSDQLKDSNDGILTAYEAQNLDLEKTDLVVLSACETGLGKFDAGEGVYGLQRAFRTAGARSVITTLWKIDDQASKDFMIAFYRNILTENDRREAFRNAQMEMKEKYKHPYYWAAFVLTGN